MTDPLSAFPSPPYEVFEHTADVGLLAYGRTLPELFIHAAQGMSSLLVPPEQVQLVTTREIEVAGQETLGLLIAWLSELIFLFDTEHLLLSEFSIETVSETRVTGRATGEVYDPLRHELGSAIKAVTWHEAAIQSIPAGLQARIIFDI
jgi:SHS2 domain-containing protein